MQLKEKWILGIYSDTSLQEVEVTYVLTDGIDILQVKDPFTRPYSYELKDKLLNITTDQLANKKFITSLEKDITQFFISIINEALSTSLKPEYICIMGAVVKNSVRDRCVVELGNFHKIATTFHLPVIGHFMQSDLAAGGVGSPLKTVFWEALSHHKEKPMLIINVGGILKLHYLGPNGEMVGFDVGVGTSLMDEWVFRHTGQSQDDDGWLSAKGKPDFKVVKALMMHPYFQKEPPKAVEKEDFNHLLKQLDGLSVSDGCATLIAFFVESFKKATAFLPPPPYQWVMTGGGLKNPSLVLALKQTFPNIQKSIQYFDFHEHLNAVGTAFLGARRLANLPISLPTTTGVKEALSGGEIFTDIS